VVVKSAKHSRPKPAGRQAQPSMHDTGVLWESPINE
jgi:hypothetical protein